MRRLPAFTLLLSLACGPAVAEDPPDPFRAIIEAARHSAEARKADGPVDPVPAVIALPKSLQVPRPYPGPARVALHAHAGPDGAIVYECAITHDDGGEVLP